MGIEIPNIWQVVHRGMLSSLMTYWQEVGHTGVTATVHDSSDTVPLLQLAMMLCLEVSTQTQ